MSLDTLREVLIWSLVINYGVLLIWFAAFTVAHDRLYRHTAAQPRAIGGSLVGDLSDWHCDAG